MSVRSDKKDSKLEIIKREGRGLRGTIRQSLASSESPFSPSDAQLLKFHGTYQQDDRDVRRARLAQGRGRAHQLMVRVALPAGILTAKQYLALDDLSQRFGDGTLRVTSRQGFQFHGVLKRRLKPIIQEINRSLLTTFGACGDVERNVMACPAPLSDPAHRQVREVAGRISRTLRPSSRAYHEIWLDSVKEHSSETEEPFYGENYLPRKFKTAVSLASDNCVDVYSADAGLIAVESEGQVSGFNLVVGGGMGMSHNNASTFAALAQPLGYMSTDAALDGVVAVASIFRDHGNRADRKHARLKYLLAEWGLDRFREEFVRRSRIPVEPARPLPPVAVDDHLGRRRQSAGRSFYGLYIPSGRIADRGRFRLRSALRQAVVELNPAVRTTPQQNLLLTDLTAEGVNRLEALLQRHGVPLPDEISAVRRHSMACPALPTCGLALGESERLIPQVLDDLETELTELGLSQAPITVRMTGCPNGCARPYTADLAFVARGPGRYHVFVGGRPAGDRIADLVAADVPPDRFVAELRPLLQRWARDRLPREGLGDFYQRFSGNRESRRRITGREEPADLPILERVSP